MGIWRTRLNILCQPFVECNPRIRVHRGPTLIMMILYSAWAAIVVAYKLHDGVDDISGVFTILGTTIAVTLPLLASAAVQRNKESLFNYNAFCGDVLALGWEILSYVRSPEDFTVSNPNKLKIQQAFEICLILPTVVKWKFRNNKEFNIDEVFMIKNYEPTPMPRTRRGSMARRGSMVLNYNNRDGDSMGRKFTKTSIGIEYRSTLLSMGGRVVDGGNGEGIDKCDLLFVFLFDIISEFEVSDTRKNMLTRTAERVYGSYGNMGNINGYKLPLMYETFMYIALFVFMFVFPFSYPTSGGALRNMDIVGVNETFWNASAVYGESVSGISGIDYHIIWHGNLVIYFLFGLNLLAVKVGNAFVSTDEALGYITVGESETNANTSLHNLYKKRLDLQKNQQLFNKNFNDMPSSPKEAKISLLTNRRKLYI